MFGLIGTLGVHVLGPVDGVSPSDPEDVQAQAV